MALSEYVFFFVQRVVDSLWSEHVKEFPSAHKYSFQIGVVKGFGEKLRAISQEKVNGFDSSQVAALVTTSKQQIEKTIGRQRYPRVSRSGSRGGRIDGRSFDAGKSEGRKVVLHKGVGSSDGFKGGLLSN